MAHQRTIRHERSFEGFSRGLEVVKAIHKLWRENDELSRRGATASQINANIDALHLQNTLRRPTHPQ